MTVYSVDSTKVGTSLVTGAGSLTAMAVTVLPTSNDQVTPVCITDGPGGPTIYSATMLAMSFLFEPRPNVALTPGTTAPTYPRALMGTHAVPFANGLYVQSCPANISLSLTA